MLNELVVFDVRYVRDEAAVTTTVRPLGSQHPFPQCDGTEADGGPPAVSSRGHDTQRGRLTAHDPRRCTVRTES